jgi:hypothetical protein
MKGLRLSTLKPDGHVSLSGSGHRNVIPYVQREWGLYCSVLFKYCLSSADSNVCVVFYSSRSQQLQCDPGPDRWPRGGQIPMY